MCGHVHLVTTSHLQHPVANCRRPCQLRVRSAFLKFTEEEVDETHVEIFESPMEVYVFSSASTKINTNAGACERLLSWYLRVVGVPGQDGEVVMQG